MAKRYELGSEEWERIKGLFPIEKWVAQPNGTIRLCSMPYFGWHDDDTLEAIFHALQEDADLENFSIDRTSIKAHPQSTGAKKGCKCRESAVY